jgi:hypothetical protein
VYFGDRHKRERRLPPRLNYILPPSGLQSGVRYYLPGPSLRVKMSKTLEDGTDR